MVIPNVFFAMGAFQYRGIQPELAQLPDAFGKEAAVMAVE